MGLVKVAVSPFFRGDSWIDECTGIKFEKNQRGLSVYQIPDTYDFTSIKRSIRLNNLMLIEGDPSIMNEVKEVVVPEPAPVVEKPAEEVVEAPAEEVVLDEQPAAVEASIEEVEKPKRKQNNKKSK